MSVRIDEAVLQAKGRPAAIVLALHGLRAMELWRGLVPNYDCARIMIAVVAITAERLLRTEIDPEYGPLSKPIDPAMLQKCNIASIAHATGLNRESTRRKVNDLIERGLLTRLDDGTIFFREGLIQEPAAAQMVRRQVGEIASAANRLLRLGVLTDG